VHAYQLFLLAVLVIWPLAIGGLLFFMSRLEQFVSREEANTPQEAGLEPVEGLPREREVRIIFGGRVVGEQDR
jgi:hypothetical protein